MKRALALALLLIAGAARAETTIYRGGAIYTLDPARPWARVLVVEDGRIVHVGDDAKKFRGRIVDLKGRMMLPAFHDAHAHPMSGGTRLLRCALGGFRTAQAMRGAIARCDASHDESWVIGNGWSRDVAPPDLAALDALVPDRPAYLATEDGFSAWVNSRTLALAGLAQKDGYVEGDALMRVRALRPQPSEALFRAALARWTDMANEAGIVAVFDASASPAMLDAYRAADAAGQLKLRVVAAQLVDTAKGPEQVDAMVARRMPGRRLRADAAKIFLDGEIDRHTAARLDGDGELLLPPQALNALVVRLDAAGFDIHMHAMGDGAVRAGLDAIAEAERKNGPRDRRPQLAHLALVAPEDVPRFKALGVTANFQPLWFQADDPATEGTDEALGPERARRLYPIATLARADARIVASSDWPATSLNPLDAIEIALTRQPLGSITPARQPDQRMTLAAMLAAYTRDAAFVAREDDGVLAAGRPADLVVLDRNLFKLAPSDIHKARVLLTVLDGEAVYQAKEWR